MAAIEIGSVKSGKGKLYHVKWNQQTGDVYISYAGWSLVKYQKAKSANEAMVKAEAWLYDK